MGARGTLERLFFSMSQRRYRLSPVAVTQACGGSSVPTLCSKDQANKT